MIIIMCFNPTYLLIPPSIFTVEIVFLDARENGHNNDKRGTIFNFHYFLKYYIHNAGMSYFITVRL